MLGWELPPFNSGGLGVACLGLSRALAGKGADITFVLPRKVNLSYDFMDLVFANIGNSEDLSNAYISSTTYREYLDDFDSAPWDYVAGSIEYAKKVGAIVKKLNIDLIHSHDWMTFPAGVAAKEVTKKPLIVHVHSTEVDRTGGHYPNKIVYNIERHGMNMADRVVSVSEFTKNIIVNNYGINSNKIEVIYNGIEEIKEKRLPPALPHLKDLGYKIVLFLGRITLMKGPEYFVRAANTALFYNNKIIFVVAGSGDMYERMIGEAARLGIVDNFVFTGFLRGEEKSRIYQSADLCVMPSVSEPFGIVPLEAIANGTPVLVSKQTGVSEILQHVLKADFWDTDEIADKILAAIQHDSLRSNLVYESSKELPNINWNASADKCLNIYNYLT
jgi:glycogen synthase